MTRALCVGVVFFALFGVSTAHAWTDAHVQTASAELRLDASGAVEVALTVRVNVRGGWLESLEIAGLDPNLVLDASPPTVVSDEGERFVARASATEDGRILLSFARRGGPTRGHHTIRLRYRADLAARFVPGDGDHVRAAWTFPGWQSGLDGVEVTLDAPAGARFVREEDSLVTLTRSREHRDGRTVLRWRRAHLPRTLSWDLSFELPRTAVASSLGSAALPAQDEAAPSHAPLARSARPAQTDRTIAGVAFVGVLSLLSILLFSWESRRRGVRARFVVPGPLALRLLALALALAAPSLAGSFEAGSLEAGSREAASSLAGSLAGSLGAESRLLGLLAAVLLALPRSPHGRAARLGSWQRVGRDELQEARCAARRSRMTVLAFSDATAPLGLATYAALFAIATTLGEVAPIEALLAAIPPLLATRHRLPRRAYERLLVLAAFAREASAERFSGLALQLALHRDTHGVAQDARLRVVTASRAPGLLRLDVVVAETPRPTGLEASCVGLVVTRESTPAERLVAAAFPELAVVRGPAGRLARMVELATLLRVARVVDVDAPRDARRTDVALRPRAPTETRIHA